MPRKEHDEELESGSINLLPDEMRSAEYKDRVSSRSNEAPYQLRAPKKERKRRRFFTWLPFFGGEHWESPGAAAAKGHATPSEAEAAHIIATESRPEEPWKPVSGMGASPIVPISDEKSGSVSPKAGKAFKKGFGFPGLPSWLGGKKKIAIPVPSGVQFGSLREHKAAMPSRHYSLLAEEQKRTGQAPAFVPAPVAPSGMPMISATDDMGNRPVTAMPERPAALKLKEKRPRRGIRWPRWLDIFYLIELIATPGPRHALRASHVPRPKTDKGFEKTEPPRMPMSSIATTTPLMHENAQGSGLIRPVVPTVVSSQPAGRSTPLPMRQITPAPLPSKKKEKRAFSFSFLRWLNFFAWFRSQPKPKKITMPESPRQAPVVPRPMPPEAISITSSPRPVQAVVPPVPIPEPRPVVQMDAARPATPPVSTSLPPSPASRPIITPITPEPERLRRGEPMKHGKPQTGLHVPGKSGLDELAMQFKDVNLIPGEYTLRGWRFISQSLVMAIVAVGVLTAVGYVLLNMEETRIKNRSAQIDTEIQKFKNDILFYQKQEPVMTSIGTRIDLVKKLLGTHIYWTNFLSMLEKYTLPDVYYDGISATPSGKLSLSAHGSNFETVTKALQLLSSPVASEFVNSVSITGAHQVLGAEGASRVDFVIELTLNSDLFYYHDGQEE